MTTTSMQIDIKVAMYRVTMPAIDNTNQAYKSIKILHQNPFLAASFKNANLFHLDIFFSIHFHILRSILNRDAIIDNGNHKFECSVVLSTTNKFGQKSYIDCCRIMTTLDTSGQFSLVSHFLFSFSDL